jgi:glycosyltransferase involved in cell wall biosynthesis
VSSRSPLIVVPAWNEEEALPKTLEELARLELRHDVLVVDDCSSDRTSQIAAEFGVRSISLPVNLGVGGAMRAGYRWALRNGYSWAVQVDADGQHDPASIADVLQPVLDGKVDISVGARFAGVGEYEAGRVRRVAMALLSWIISAIVGTKLTDTTSGFKAANLAAIKVFADEFPMEYLGDTVEALIIAHKAGLRIGQVPVSMRERQGGAPSQAAWRAGVFLIRAVLAVGVAATRGTTKAVSA